MNVSLDYDNTYTRDPDLWDDFIILLKRKGHKVYCVTMRNSSESKVVFDSLLGKVDGIFLTDRKAKHPFMFREGISIDVWIDDIPWFIDNNAAH